MKKQLYIALGLLFCSISLTAQMNTSLENPMAPQSLQVDEAIEGIDLEPFSGPDVPPPLPEPGVPIDGGVLGLLALGAGLGAKKIRQFKKSERHMAQ